MIAIMAESPPHECTLTAWESVVFVVKRRDRAIFPFLQYPVRFDLPQESSPFSAPEIRQSVCQRVRLPSRTVRRHGSAGRTRFLNSVPWGPPGSFEILCRFPSSWLQEYPVQSEVGVWLLACTDQTAGTNRKASHRAFERSHFCSGRYRKAMPRRRYSWERYPGLGIPSQP